MTIKFAVGLLKVFWLIVVLCLLIGHGSRTGPIVTELPPPTPCGKYIRDNQPYFCIDFEDTAQDINAIAGLSVIDRDLIVYKTNLTDLDFLSNITSIQGRLTIADNNSLRSLSTTATITELNSLVIEHNLTLTSLTGLNNITQIPGWVTIYDNIALDTLANFSVGEVVERIYIVSNKSLADLSALRNLTTVTGWLNVGNNNLSDLSDLNSLETVGELGISEAAIEHLYGLENLTSVSNLLTIAGCDILLDFAGMTALNSYNSLSIRNNDMLTSLSTLAFIPTTLDKLELIGNNSLTDIQSLSVLTSASDIEITQNVSLKFLSGLSNLLQSNSLVIDNNMQLMQLGMSALSRIDSELIIRDNDMLCEQEAQNLISQILSQGGIGAAGNTTEGIIVSGNLNCP
jgi:hypothetical protein